MSNNLKDYKIDNFQKKAIDENISVFPDIAMPQKFKDYIYVKISPWAVDFYFNALKKKGNLTSQEIYEYQEDKNCMDGDVYIWMQRCFNTFNIQKVKKFRDINSYDDIKNKDEILKVFGSYFKYATDQLSSKMAERKYRKIKNSLPKSLKEIDISNFDEGLMEKVRDYFGPEEKFSRLEVKNALKSIDGALYAFYLKKYEYKIDNILLKEEYASKYNHLNELLNNLLNQKDIK